MNENHTNAANSHTATFLGHPRGLVTLFCTEMWERFSYYGMRALLVLFLVDAVQHGGLGLTDRTATAIYGLYTAGVYLASLPGGWIADRLIGAQRAVWWGGIVIMCGHTVLGVAATPGVFFLGLIAIVVGTGLLKPNIGAMVADLYPEGGGRRDAGYTIYYFGVNFGATIGQIVTSWLAVSMGWSAGFFAAAVGMALGLIQFKMMGKLLGGAGSLPQVPSSNSDSNSGVDTAALAKKYWQRLLLATGAMALIVALVFFGAIPFDPLTVAQFSAYVILLLAIAAFSYLLFFAGLQGIERTRVVVIMVLFVASSIFWAGFEQTGSSLNLFADRYTDRMITWLNFEIPAGWFQSVNTALILICAPILATLWLALAKRNKDISSGAKMALGLLFLGAGFFVMAGAARYVAEGFKVAPSWLIGTYLLHTFGELCLSPIGMSAFTKLVPPRFVGQILGVWFMSISLGSLLAGLIAGEFDPQHLDAMQGQFMNIVWFAVLPGVLLLLLAKPLKKAVGGVQ
jgi:POT family proton-dependent oligopeptide transporter